MSTSIFALASVDSVAVGGAADRSAVEVDQGARSRIDRAAAALASGLSRAERCDEYEKLADLVAHEEFTRRLFFCLSNDQIDADRRRHAMLAIEHFHCVPQRKLWSKP